MIHLSNSATIQPHYVNRHTLITGPTGTGKTVTVLRLIEELTRLGVPVLAPDVKGDLAQMAHTTALPTVPAWAFGADLLARALQLTDVQSGVLEIVFAHADEVDAPFSTLSDLRAILTAIAHTPASVAHIGHVTRASIGTIQRALLRLPSDIMGAPALDVGPMLDKPCLHLIDARALYHSPALYSAFLLYLLRDLATRLPEVGDLDRPRFVLVFDEAHTIFHEASPSLLRSVEATARLIRSKGVGLVWASQSPNDIPAIVRAQCATTIAHSREFGVGRCAFTTLDASGRVTQERMVTPIMPTLGSCPMPASAPAQETPRQPSITARTTPQETRSVQETPGTTAIVVAVAVTMGAFTAFVATAISPWFAVASLVALALIGRLATQPVIEYDEKESQ